MEYTKQLLKIIYLIKILLFPYLMHIMHPKWYNTIIQRGGDFILICMKNEKMVGLYLRVKFPKACAGPQILRNCATQRLQL